MKNILFACAFIFSGIAASAQNIYRISITNDGKFSGVSILTAAENVTINLLPDGSIGEWGVEVSSNFNKDYTRLEKYLGRSEYYTERDNESFRGKPKYIGNTAITYYASYENDSLKGKVKTIGTLQVEYYQPYEDAFQKGRIKSIGGSTFSYYTSFENEAFRGKLKQVGNTPITYYSSFDDKAFRGKLKSIGNVSYSYYSSFDRQYAGAMKTATQSVYVNGINFVLKW